MRRAGGSTSTPCTCDDREGFLRDIATFERVLLRSGTRMSPVDLALLGLGVAFALGLARIILGPSVADRAVATDLCLFSVVGVISLTVVRTGSPQFVDVVLIATLLGFLASIAIAALIGRGN